MAPPYLALQDPITTLSNVDSIQWIDWTAIVLLGVFFILGLFKGLLWQVTRVVSLVTAWFLAGYYGPQVKQLLGRWFADEPDLALYLAYVIIFVLAVVVLSIVGWLLQKLVKKTGMTFYDRVSGAGVGLVTGTTIVIVILAGVYMFMPETRLAAAARRSTSMTISQKSLRLLGDVVPKPMQDVFELAEKPR